MGDASLSERDSRKSWAYGKAYTGICQYQGNGNKTAEYVGTAFMARDMARVAEAVDKDGLIRYWGMIIPVEDQAVLLTTSRLLIWNNSRCYYRSHVPGESRSYDH